MSKMKQISSAVTVLLGLLASQCALAQTPVTPAAAAESTEVGQVVARDPVTGKLRAATADEMGELQRQHEAAKANRRQAQPERAGAQAIRRHASGARGIRMGEEHMSSAMTTRNADGSLSQTCVDGVHAHDALEHAAHSKSNAAPKE